MSQVAQPTDDEFVNELVREGIAKFALGNRQEAHDLWRQAAALRPHDEDIWGALLSVVETVEDRHVCLKNIVAINPKNERATQQLRSLEPIIEAARKQQNQFSSLQRRPNIRRLLRALSMLQGIKLLILLIAILIVVALGVMIGIILQ
jgi:hypothetical protein